MAIEVRCGHCGQALRVPENYAAKRGRCKRCGATVEIPAAAPPVADEYAVVETPESPKPARAPIPQPVPASPTAKPAVRTSRDKSADSKSGKGFGSGMILGLVLGGLGVLAVAGY